MITNDLQTKLGRYLEFRRASGLKMRAEQTLLFGFVEFIRTCEPQAVLTAQRAMEWACSSGCGPSGQAARLSMVRQFLIFLQASEPRIEVPPPRLLPQPLRPIPHIYPDEEINALILEASRLGPRGSLRPDTYSTLIGLLASCGLRVGEAIRLRVGDVQLSAQPPRLHVLDSKFGKSRIVPLHPTVAMALATYTAHRRELGYDGHCAAFLVSEAFAPLNRFVVIRTFAKLIDRAGITGGSGGRRRPTAHQLRHTFAVRRLVAWLREGEDVHGRLPELSVYLGHRQPSETYWYFTATPELLRLATGRFEKSCATGGAL
jgi:integrase